MICNRAAPVLGLGHFLYAFIFLSGGHAATDMPFPFILIQNFPYLRIELRVMVFQTLGYIFVYRGFGNVKVFCCRSDSCAGFNHVHSQFAGSFLQRF